MKQVEHRGECWVWGGLIRCLEECGGTVAREGDNPTSKCGMNEKRCKNGEQGKERKRKRKRG